MRLLLMALALIATVRGAQAVEISVLYSQAFLYKDAHETIAREFTKLHPDVTIRFLAPAKVYEDATATVLRGAMTGSMPDVVFTGTNLLRIFVDRNLAVPLDPLIAGEKDWASAGYIDKMIATGRVDDRQIGLPFALSTPVMYLNADLVRRAGGDPTNPPKTWDDVFALAKKVNALGGGAKGLFMHWQTTGNYLWQALLFSNGGQLLKDRGTQVAFDSGAGLRSFEVVADLVREGGMPNYSREQGRQEFTAGLIAMQFSSSAELTLVSKQIGERFELVTAPFPVPQPDVPIVSGGGTSVILARDPEKQHAAWEYVKFTISPPGQTIMATTTGYLPSNQIAIDTPSLLGDYYQGNPNARTSLSQLTRATPWQGFPGDNGIKIIDGIYNVMEGLITRKLDPPQALSRAVSESNALLPK
jgi:multiple sugar transport system substrate-binding protein